MRTIDADALVDAMTGACNIFDAHGVDTTIARTLITVAAKAPTVGGWISAKDRMPDENEEVILFYEWTGRFSGNKYQEVGLDTIADLGKEYFVIAWMPLPEPPKEVDLNADK